MESVDTPHSPLSFGHFAGVDPPPAHQNSPHTTGTRRVPPRLQIYPTKSTTTRQASAIQGASVYSDPPAREVYEDPPEMPMSPDRCMTSIGAFGLWWLKDLVSLYESCTMYPVSEAVELSP